MEQLMEVAKKACGAHIPGLDPEKLVEATKLEDVGCDSVGLTEIVMDIEDELDMEIPTDKLEKVRTYGDLLKVVKALR